MREVPERHLGTGGEQLVAHARMALRLAVGSELPSNKAK